MITLYHLSQSRSERIIWLLEELGESYELKRFNRLETGLAPPDYRALHPVGTSPVIRDGEAVLTETGGITQYVLGRYGGGRLVPDPASPDYPLYCQWMHFAEGSAAPTVMAEAILRPTVVDGQVKPNRAALWRDRNDRILGYIDAALGERPYFAGEAFTGADLMMAPNLSLYGSFIGRPLGDYRNVTAYSERVFTRPAYVRAMEIANPGGRRPFKPGNPFARGEE
jgi:glutathione S-transferase